MTNRDEERNPTTKDNVDPRLEPKNATDPERAPRGSVSMPSPSFPGRSSLQPEGRFAGVTADYERKKEGAERGERGKENRPIHVLTGDKEVDEFFESQKGADGKALYRVLSEQEARAHLAAAKEQFSSKDDREI